MIIKRYINVFSVFANSVKRQVKENKEFQKNVQLLADEQNRLGGSEALAAAKKAMKTTSTTTTKVFETAGKTMDAVIDSKVVQTTGKVIQKVADPILKTEAVKTIKQQVLDSASNAQYAEYKTKEEREKQRQERLAAMRLKNPLLTTSRAPNPDAGTSLQLHTNPEGEAKGTIGKAMDKISEKLDQLDSPFVDRVRETFYRWFIQETEQVRVIKAFKNVDLMFRPETFLKEATEYIVPEILEGLLDGDVKALEPWLSQKAYAVFSSNLEAQNKQGLVSHCKLLDIRNVDIRKMSILENDLPVILVTCDTQEILLFKNKDGKVEAGKEDQIQGARYVFAFTKNTILDPKATFNEKTNDWTVVEFFRQSF